MRRAIPLCMPYYNVPSTTEGKGRISKTAWSSHNMSHGPRSRVLSTFFFLDGKVERDEQSERGRDGRAWHRSVGGGCGRKKRKNEADVDRSAPMYRVHLLLFTSHPFRAFRSTSPHCRSANSRPTFTSSRRCNPQAVARASAPVDTPSLKCWGSPAESPTHLVSFDPVRAYVSIIFTPLLPFLLNGSATKRPLFYCHNTVPRRPREESRSLVVVGILQGTC
jgi:hypothetical protein